MQEIQIEEEFAEKLNNLDLLEEADVDAICWFISDFEKAAAIFVQQIVNRIINPYQVHFFKHQTPLITLFYLIDGIISNNPSVYTELFAPYIIEAFNVATNGNDKNIDKLRQLATIWATNNVFGEQISNDLQKIINPSAFRNESIVAVEPLAFQQTEPPLESFEIPVEEQLVKQRAWLKPKNIWVTTPSEIAVIEAPPLPPLPPNDVNNEDKENEEQPQ